jgi:hypothetical protein
VLIIRDPLETRPVLNLGGGPNPEPTPDVMLLLGDTAAAHPATRPW